MAVPTHDPDCTTKAWPTTCPDCGRPVFFFACTCGSKVLFDALGDPWPKHYERCVAHHVRVLRDAEGLSLEDVHDRVTRAASRTGASIGDDITNLFRALRYRETGEATPLRLLPDAEDREFIGTVTSINTKVNFYKRFNYVKNDIGRALLGALVSEEYVELRFNAPVDPTTGFRAFIDAYMTARLFRNTAVVRGQVVRVALRPHVLRDKTKLWTVVELSHDVD